MSYLLISTSLNPKSRSAALAKKAYQFLVERKKLEAEWLDLRELALPHCDGGAAYEHENVAKLTGSIQKAKCILMAVPVYNFNCSSAAKNVIELAGGAFEDKIVGFLCAAGGKSSYMSIMGLANSLMLDFRSLIIPRFVYADSGSFKESDLDDTEIESRIEQLVEYAAMLHEARI